MFLLPIRCFTCGKVLIYKDYKQYERYCCKRMILTNPEINK